jgi:trk system potassium uptake protein TrkA
MANRRPLEFAVIGLGRFGVSAALALMEDGHHVLGIDDDRELVQEYADQLTHTVLADATNEDALRELEVESYDTIIVAIGQNFEASVLTTASLKGMGARRVICKALTQRQADILHRVGADQVVLPEIEAGLQLARQLSRPRLLDEMREIPGVSVAEVAAPPHMVGKTLAETNLRQRHGVMVLAVRSGESMQIAPQGAYKINDGDVLVTLGTTEDIEKFSKDA